MTEENSKSTRSEDSGSAVSKSGEQGGTPAAKPTVQAKSTADRPRPEASAVPAPNVAIQLSDTPPSNKRIPGDGTDSKE